MPWRAAEGGCLLMHWSSRRNWDRASRRRARRAPFSPDWNPRWCVLSRGGPPRPMNAGFMCISVSVMAISAGATPVRQRGQRHAPTASSYPRAIPMSELIPSGISGPTDSPVRPAAHKKTGMCAHPGSFTWHCEDWSWRALHAVCRQNAQAEGPSQGLGQAVGWGRSRPRAKRQA